MERLGRRVMGRSSEARALRLAVGILVTPLDLDASRTAALQRTGLNT